MKLEKEIKGALVRNMKMVHEPRHKWPVEKKIEVVTKFLALGNLRLVSELTGVSYGLIRMWKMEPWWADLVAEIKATRQIAVGNKLSKIVDKSLEMIEDRLVNGDVKWNSKTEEIERRPLPLLTVNKIANDLMVRGIELEKQKVVETSTQQQQTVADQIRQLAAEFAKFNTNRTINVQAKDVTDAIPKEREEGLRSGESLGPLTQWGSENQGSSGAEQSPSDRGEGGEGPQGGWQGRGPQEAAIEGWEDSEVEPEGSDSSCQPFLPENIKR